jgi:prolyl 4-hydroxylase
LVAEEPYARLFEQVLSTAECSYLIETTESRFEPSMVYNKARELVRDTIRTSDGAAIHWLIEDPAIHALNRRIASMTGTRFESGEALQVLRYSPGQEYRPHFDFVEGAQNQRLWTALIYLNNDYEGGETAFVRTGAEVRGKAGDVLVFRNARADGSPDPLAEHAGMPVTSGTKYLATRWIRESRWIP